MYFDGIKNSAIIMQAQPESVKSVFHLFVITTPDRDKFVNYLKEKHINCGFHYPVPCHLQKAYAHLGYKKGQMQNAEYLADHCVSLPMFPELTDEEVSIVIDTCNSYKS